MIPAAPETDRSSAWWLWPQRLCVDAPAVIVLWAAAFAHAQRLHLGALAYLALGLAAWIVYVIDRVGDSRSMGGGTTERHRFCYRHQLVLIRVLVPIAAVVVLWLGGFYLPSMMLIQGFTIGVLASFYLLLYAVPPGGWLQRVMMAVALGCMAWMAMNLHSEGGTNGALIRGAMVLSLLWVLFALGQDSVIKRWRALTPKTLPAALLITLGCLVPVQAWSLGEHRLMGPEAWLFCLLVVMNLHLIRAAEATQSARSARADLWVCAVAGGGLIGLVIWGHTHLLHRGTLDLMNAGVVSAALLAGLAMLRARLGAETLHLLADIALVLPLFWMFGLAR